MPPRPSAAMSAIDKILQWDTDVSPQRLPQLSVTVSSCGDSECDASDGVNWQAGALRRAASTRAPAAGRAAPTPRAAVGLVDSPAWRRAAAPQRSSDGLTPGAPGSWRASSWPSC
eukprot:EG_transcript_53755